MSMRHAKTFCHHLHYSADMTSNSPFWQVTEVLLYVDAVTDGNNGLIETLGSWVFAVELVVTEFTPWVHGTGCCNDFVLCTTVVKPLPLWTEAWALRFVIKLLVEVAILPSGRQRPLVEALCQHTINKTAMTKLQHHQCTEFTLINTCSMLSLFL